jgi:oxygen-independent coproporphyrinogen-3 oxidase
MSGEPVRAVCDDGVALALYRAGPEAPVRGLPVLLVHGTFSNRNFFLGRRERGLARYLAGRGFDAWVAELRGHGRSGATGRAASWHFEDWIRLDAPALVGAVLAATGAPRVVWVGHSAGGIIGLGFSGLGHPRSRDIAGLVVAGSPAPTGLGVMQRPLARAAYGITRVMGRFPARLIGIGPEDEHAGIMAQWMRWNLSGRWHGDDGTDYFANCATITVPILALAGGGDWAIAPPSLCEDLVDATASADRTFIACGKAEGFGEDFNHNRLLVSTPARREVWPLIADWIESRFA